MENQNPIFLVFGPPAVGKSTTSRALAAGFPKSLHIPVDDVRDMVVSGKVLPSGVWTDDLIQQLTLARESAAHMALRYQKAGFAVIIDDFWDANYLHDYRALLGHPHVRKVVLYPRQEEAHQRNLQRAGDHPSRAYIDEGIEIVYQQLRQALPQIIQQGWIIVDTTTLSVEEAVAEILAQAEQPGSRGEYEVEADRSRQLDGSSRTVEERRIVEGQNGPLRNREEERKPAKARQSLVALRRQISDFCGQGSSADQWDEFLQERVQPLLATYGDVLGEETRGQIEQAIGLFNGTRKGIHQSCDVLQRAVNQGIHKLPTPILEHIFEQYLKPTMKPLLRPLARPVSQAVAGGFVAVAGMIGAGALGLSMLTSTVLVKNNGCAPIDLTAYQDLNRIPGIELPEEIGTGDEATLKIVPLSMAVDTRQAGQFTIQAFGFPFNGETGSLESIGLDDLQAAIGSEFSLEFQPGVEHHLQLNCR